MEHYQDILRPDSRGRITLGTLAMGVSGYKVSRGKYGKITLEPQVEIPAHEAWLYKNKKRWPGCRKELLRLQTAKANISAASRSLPMMKLSKCLNYFSSREQLRI